MVVLHSMPGPGAHREPVLHLIGGQPPDGNLDQRTGLSRQRSRDYPMFVQVVETGTANFPLNGRIAAPREKSKPLEVIALCQRWADGRQR